MGSPTFLTTHHVNAEEDASAKKPYTLKKSCGEL